MDACVFCYYYFSILLLLHIQLSFEASREEFKRWVRCCKRIKTRVRSTRNQVQSSLESDSDVVFKPLRYSCSFPPVALPPQIFDPNSAYFAEIQEVLNRDAKVEDFIKHGGPSFNRQVINLAQKIGEAAYETKTAVVGEAKTAMVTRYVSSVEQAMKLDETQIADLEKRTRENRNELWAEKRTRLTADLFSSICIGNDAEALGTWMTSPRPTLDPELTRAEWVLSVVQEQIKKPVRPSGLFVDRTRGYLAALPDGLIEDNAVVKLHVLHRVRLDASQYQWDRGYALLPYEPLYYEIQGLLAITQKELCYVVIVSVVPWQYVIVPKNEAFWKWHMVEKLENFYLNVLTPRLSMHNLPDIKNIRLAVNMIHVVTTKFTIEEAQEITRKTQNDAFDILKSETKLRLLAKDFYVIMGEKKSMKEKVEEILQNQYEDREAWESERKLKMEAVIRYSKQKNLDVALGGLIIDRANPFLAALPSATGRRKSRRVFAISARRQLSARIARTWGKDDPDLIFEVVMLEQEQAGDTQPPSSEKYSANKGTANYFKIQGSLAISRAKTCVYMVVQPNDKLVAVEQISFDPAVWNDMLERLRHFYFSAYLIYLACPAEFERMFSPTPAPPKKKRKKTVMFRSPVFT